MYTYVHFLFTYAHHCNYIDNELLSMHYSKYLYCYSCCWTPEWGISVIPWIFQGWASCLLCLRWCHKRWYVGILFYIFCCWIWDHCYLLHALSWVGCCHVHLLNCPWCTDHHGWIGCRDISILSGPFSSWKHPGISWGQMAWVWSGIFLCVFWM